MASRPGPQARGLPCQHVNVEQVFPEKQGSSVFLQVIWLNGAPSQQVQCKLFQPKVSMAAHWSVH